MNALVIGGASTVWDDLAALREWTPGCTVVVNDIGTVYPRFDAWATLHAEKLDGWKAERTARGLPGGYVTWGRPEKPGTDRTLAGWTSGSSGMFGVGVALAMGAESVVVAGVPLDARPHFFDEAAWESFHLYRRAWERRVERLRGRVWSMSGWTRELLGEPPVDLLTGKVA